MKTAGLFFLIFFASVSSAQAQETDIFLAPGYQNSIVLYGVSDPIAFTFDFEGNYIVAQKSKNGSRLIKVDPAKGEETVLLERTDRTITHLSFSQGTVYVVSPGKIAVIKQGKLSDIVSLPSVGDYLNSQVIFSDGYMYFATGTATNSGIVGPDNPWLLNNPSVHDLLCKDLRLTGYNHVGDNFLTEKRNDKAQTGSFMPYNTAVLQNQIMRSSNKCNGVVFRARPDGSDLKVLAWGLHNPKGLAFDGSGDLYVLDGGMEDRGVRAIKGGKDALYKVSEGSWFGWPDFSAGSKVDAPALITDYPPLSQPVRSFDLGKYKNYAIADFNFKSGLAQTDAQSIEYVYWDQESKDFLKLPKSQSIVQVKPGPDRALYVMATDKQRGSVLYKIESTRSVSPAIGQTRNFRIPLVLSLNLITLLVGLVAVYTVQSRIRPAM